MIKWRLIISIRRETTKTDFSYTTQYFKSYFNFSGNLGELLGVLGNNNKYLCYFRSQHNRIHILKSDKDKIKFHVNKILPFSCKNVSLFYRNALVKLSQTIRRFNQILINWSYDHQSIVTNASKHGLCLYLANDTTNWHLVQ